MTAAAPQPLTQRPYVRTETVLLGVFYVARSQLAIGYAIILCSSPNDLKWSCANGFYILSITKAKMIFYFYLDTPGSSDDLFTVFDYKRLVDLVEQHFTTDQGKAYYNPSSNKGCVIFESHSYYDIQDIEFPNGSDILTVKWIH